MKKNEINIPLLVFRKRGWYSNWIKLYIKVPGVENTELQSRTKIWYSFDWIMDSFYNLQKKRNF